jgi:predicted DNA-binding transcriptional regulator AlpA
MVENILQPVAIRASDVAVLLSCSTRQVWAMHANGILGPSCVTLSERLSRWDAGEIRSWWDACLKAGRTIPRVEWIRMQNGENCDG